MGKLKYLIWGALTALLIYSIVTLELYVHTEFASQYQAIPRNLLTQLHTIFFVLGWGIVLIIFWITEKKRSIQYRPRQAFFLEFLRLASYTCGILSCVPKIVINGSDYSLCFLFIFFIMAVWSIVYASHHTPEK